MNTQLVRMAVCAAFLLTACKGKSESDEPIKVPDKKSDSDSKTDSSATATATATASAADAPSAAPTASAAAADSQKAADPSTTGAAVAGGPKEGIDKCCAALNAVHASGLGKETKQKSSAAASVCPGISKLVKAGTVARGAALTQVKSALAGASVPAACN